MEINISSSAHPHTHKHTPDPVRVTGHWYRDELHNAVEVRLGPETKCGVQTKGYRDLPVTSGSTTLWTVVEPSNNLFKNVITNPREPFDTNFLKSSGVCKRWKFFFGKIKLYSFHSLPKQYRSIRTIRLPITVVSKWAIFQSEHFFVVKLIKHVITL